MMRIGIMLRHYEQKEGGVKVYTRSLLPLLFALGAQHQYVLIYQNPKLIGTYAHYSNVEEISLGMRGTVLWDQIGIPWIAFRERLDLIFNPKFTVPLLGRAAKVFVLHGSEWFAIPEHFLWYDRLYLRYAVPRYFHAADAFVAVSQAVKRDAIRYMRVSGSKIAAIPNGFDPKRFRVIEDRELLARVTRQYSLPKRFILWAGQIESRKNLGRLLQAFARLRDEIPHHLVLAGAQRFTFPMAAGAERDLQLIEELGLQERVHFTGWISHQDLPAVYNLAELFAFPSLYEGFGIPLLEAMACGCPIVTATTCAPPEVAGDAACLVDPLEVEQIATGIRTMLNDAHLRETKIRRGLARVAHYSWERCAQEVLALFESVAHTPATSSSQAAPRPRGRLDFHSNDNAGA
jgi:glycosyltransferase involved in cell wall biosynthesis